MISRKTLLSLLVALLLAGCIKAYTLSLHNPCEAYLAGQRDAPETVVVNPQGRAYQVPCNQWFLRQPPSVQVLCLADGGVFIVFLFNAVADWQRRRTAAF
jgi:hypothetical protein